MPTSARPASAPAGRRRAAAALCVRRKRGRVQVLLVTSRSGQPTLPKGRIEPGEEPAEAALREAAEEAGVRGDVRGHIGSWCHGRSRQPIEAYLVRVREEGRPHRSERWRRVRWVDVDRAAEQLAGRCVQRADRAAVREALASAADRLTG